VSFDMPALEQTGNGGNESDMQFLKMGHVTFTNSGARPAD